MTVGRLHVLTDAALGAAAMASVVAAIGAGAPVVQVRGKGVTDRELYEFTRSVLARCAGTGDAGASSTTGSTSPWPSAPHGTHLGADDLPVAAARRLAGPGHLLGGTARDPDTAAALVAAGADYLGVGPAFATTTKSGLPDPIGPAGHRRPSRGRCRSR